MAPARQCLRSAGGVTRGVAPRPIQLELFALLPEPARYDLTTAAVEAATPSWVTRYWPDYAHAPKMPSRRTLSLDVWASSLRVLTPVSSSHALLMTIALETAETGRCRLSVPTLAQANNICTSTCRVHIDRLTAAGLLMIKPWIDPTKAAALSLGYEFKLILDDNDRATAFAHGFGTIRRSSSAIRSARNA